MRLLKRLLLGLLAIILVLGFVLILSVPIDALRTRGKVAALTNTDINVGDVPVKAYVAPAEPSEPRPAIIMIHEFWGLKPSILGKADALAEEGYFVVAPDTFRGQTTSWLPRAIWQTIRKSEDEVNTDLGAVYQWLTEQPGVDAERIMIMGFCYGGRAALAYSLINPNLAATGVFYGMLELTESDAERLPGPVLGIFGEEDSSIPISEVQALEAALSGAGIPNEIELYPNVGHAFVGSIEDIRAGGEDAKAWQSFLEFAERILNPS